MTSLCYASEETESSRGGHGEAKTAVLCIYTLLPSSLSVYSHSLQLAILTRSVFGIPCALHLFGVLGLCCVPTIIPGAGLHTNAAWGRGVARGWGVRWASEEGLAGSNEGKLS